MGRKRMKGGDSKKEEGVGYEKIMRSGGQKIGNRERYG